MHEDYNGIGHSLNFQVCAYISATNDVLVLGKSAAFQWNVMSENYFSVTFRNGSSVDTTTPRYVRT